MDQLEKHIRDNQSEFDRIEQVDAEALWRRMQSASPATRGPATPSPSAWQLRIGRNWQLSAAAAVLLLLGLATWLYSGSEHPANPLQTQLSVTDYYPDLADEEQAFQRMIAHREAELRLEQVDRQQFIDIFNELDELERIHRGQMEDLPEIFNNQEWVETLMRYYEQKLRILDRLAREIDKQDQLEGRSEARSI